MFGDFYDWDVESGECFVDEGDLCFEWVGYFFDVGFVCDDFDYVVCFVVWDEVDLLLWMLVVILVGDDVCGFVYCDEFCDDVEQIMGGVDG